MTHILTTMSFVFLDGFADPYTAVPNLGLVNQETLDKILRAEVFVRSDGQLRADHLILGYTPISKSFQAPNCVIKAKDPLLHWISIVAPGFLVTGLVPEGTLTTVPLLEGTFATAPILEKIPRVAPPLQHTAKKAISSRPIAKKEEEDRGMVELIDSKNKFAIFNQPLSPNSPVQVDNLQGDIIVSEEMGIQRKPRTTLQELLES